MLTKPTYKELEKRVAELEQQVDQHQTEAIKYQTLFSSFPHGISVSDAHGNILESNIVAELLLGVSKDVHEKRKIDGQEWRIIRPDGTEMPPEEWASVVALKEKRLVSNCEMGIVKNNDETVWLNVTAAPIPLKNYGVVITYNNITELKQAEKDLKTSEKQYREFFEEILSGSYVSSPDGRLLACNEEYTRILGLSSIQQALDSPIEPFYGDLSVRSEFLERVRNEKRVRHFESELRKTDGTLVNVLENATGVFDEKGNLIRIRGYFMDITERKQAGEALKKSEVLLKATLESTADGILVVDEKGQIIHSNKRFAKMWRIPNGLIESRDDEKLLNYVLGQLKDPKAFLSKVQELYKTPKKDFGTLVFKDERIFERYSRPLIRGEEIAGRVWSFRDVTEKNRAQEALRTSHERFLTVLDSIDATIFVADMETYEVLFMNKHMIEGFGRDMTGEKCWDVFKEESEPCQHCTNVKLIDENGKPTGVVVWQDKNPITEKWYINYDRAIEWTDGRMVKLQIATDITELKRIEDQLRQAQKMEAIGTLAGGIAHEFNNILGIVLGNIELAMDDLPKGSPAKDFLEEIQTASLRAKELVQHMLSFARKSHVERKPLSLSLIIQDVIKILRSSLPSSIDIRKEIKCENDTILADPTQINQVVINICTNSAYSMQEEGVIEVRLENVLLDEEVIASYESLSPGNYVKMTVKDDGHGIKPEDISQIFDPYFTTKDVGEGTGLGLSVVHGIVMSHDGAIKVSSELGKGTVVEVLLPVTEDEIEHAIEEPEDSLTGDERILFVDDEASLVKMVPQMLGTLGYQVEAMTNPDEALELFRSKPDAFDLVISDMTMPQMTGDKLAQKLMEIRPDIPIIISTGFSEKVDEDKAKEMGIKTVTMKPYEMRTLAVTVRKVLDEK